MNLEVPRNSKSFSYRIPCGSNRSNEEEGPGLPASLQLAGGEEGAADKDSDTKETESQSSSAKSFFASFDARASANRRGAEEAVKKMEEKGGGNYPDPMMALD